LRKRLSQNNGLRYVEKQNKEITGQKRNRLFCYDRYLKILSEGTEPLP